MKRSGSSVTLADVSKDAGVSVMTVSNVVRGKTDLVRLETRRRVEASIARLNYRPNLSARSLRLLENRSVGIVVADSDPAFLTDPFISRLVSGLSIVVGCCRPRVYCFTGSSTETSFSRGSIEFEAAIRLRITR